MLSRPPLDFPTQTQIREDAILGGAFDPASFRFRITEYSKLNGELLGVAAADLSFTDAFNQTLSLVQEREDSHFCLEPAGRVQ